MKQEKTDSFIYLSSSNVTLPTWLLSHFQYKRTVESVVLSSKNYKRKRKSSPK